MIFWIVLSIYAIIAWLTGGTILYLYNDEKLALACGMLWPLLLVIVLIVAIASAAIFPALLVTWTLQKNADRKVLASKSAK